jgi:hypothetical protein
MMSTGLSCHSSKSSSASAGEAIELDDNGTTEIFGGTPVSDDDELTTAVFQLKFTVNGDDNICTASRIGPRTLITAAHCAQSEKIQAWQQGKLFAEISEKIVHPKYLERKSQITRKKQWTQGNEFDVALLFLPSSLSASGGHPEGSIFDLVDGDWTPTENSEPIWAAGFGWASYNAMSGARGGDNELKQVEMKSRSSERKEILSFLQTEGKGICVGDSGGPAFSNFQQKLKLYGVAISVQNPGNASVCQGASSFINVARLRPWIDRHLQ